ncbi:transporter [Dyella solisilvae]|uniref:Transporter n=1 Tax=Dyella solisilvae TaxID=1920168 RepID=A0A370K542_9GAMM|nr:transporter [Dyella solisilvae]RDI97754.1 transporter [Dyella solisilvae]
MKRLALLPLVIASAIAIAIPAHATEGGLGRPITGLQATSYSGLIPPTPGWTFAVSYAYYDGTISGTREVPLTGGGTSLGLEGRFDLLSLTGVYIWNTKSPSWNFASMVTVPFAYVDVTANLRLGPLSGSKSDSDTGLYDMTFAPVIASHHFSQTQHLSLSLYIYAPTGDYKTGQLANPSLNNWTFSPTVGYTQLFQEGSLEWSTTTAVDFYTKNNATDYQNGAVFRIDSLLMKRFPTGWGVGAVGGWIYQLEKDSGPTADLLNGFKGRSLALGPMVNYMKKWQGGQVEFSLRWLHEFDVKNRLKGNPALLSATIAL